MHAVGDWEECFEIPRPSSIEPPSRLPPSPASPFGLLGGSPLTRAAAPPGEAWSLAPRARRDHTSSRPSSPWGTPRAFGLGRREAVSESREGGKRGARKNREEEGEGGRRVGEKRRKVGGLWRGGRRPGSGEISVFCSTCARPRADICELFRLNHLMYALILSTMPRTGLLHSQWSVLFDSELHDKSYKPRDTDNGRLVCNTCCCQHYMGCLEIGATQDRAMHKSHETPILPTVRTVIYSYCAHTDGGRGGESER